MISSRFSAALRTHARMHRRSSVFVSYSKRILAGRAKRGTSMIMLGCFMGEEPWSAAPIAVKPLLPLTGRSSVSQWSYMYPPRVQYDARQVFRWIRFRQCGAMLLKLPCMHMRHAYEAALSDTLSLRVPPGRLLQGEACSNLRYISLVAWTVS